MDPEPVSRSNTLSASPEHPGTAESPIRDDASTKSEEPNSRSSDAISSPASNSTQESMFHTMSITQSPPIQVMERPAEIDYENGRVPSCVFTDRSASSLEWSSVSDESLFSIGVANSFTRDQAYILTGDASGKLTEYGDMMSFREHPSPMDGESDMYSLPADTPSKLDDPRSSLDEPQKVVRWKTQVEHPADIVGSQCHQWQPSPFIDHKSSDLGNQVTPKPKKRSCWSWCNCGSCNMPKWSCWNGCWTYMTCSNCKPKKVSSSHSVEASAPATAAKPPKPASKTGCLCRSCLDCSTTWLCACHCY